MAISNETQKLIEAFQDSIVAYAEAARDNDPGALSACKSALDAKLDEILTDASPEVGFALFNTYFLAAEQVYSQYPKVSDETQYLVDHFLKVHKLATPFIALVTATRFKTTELSRASFKLKRLYKKIEKQRKHKHNPNSPIYRVKDKKTVIDFSIFTIEDTDALALAQMHVALEHFQKDFLTKIDRHIKDMPKLQGKAAIPQIEEEIRVSHDITQKQIYLHEMYANEGVHQLFKNSANRDNEIFLWFRASKQLESILDGDSEPNPEQLEEYVTLLETNQDKLTNLSMQILQQQTGQLLLQKSEITQKQLAAINASEFEQAAQYVSELTKIKDGMTSIALRANALSYREHTQQLIRQAKDRLRTQQQISEAKLGTAMLDVDMHKLAINAEDTLPQLTEKQMLAKHYQQQLDQQAAKLNAEALIVVGEVAQTKHALEELEYNIKTLERQQLNNSTIIEATTQRESIRSWRHLFPFIAQTKIGLPKMEEEKQQVNPGKRTLLQRIETWFRIRKKPEIASKNIQKKNVDYTKR